MKVLAYAGYIAGAIVLLLLIFQLCFRYDYLAIGGQSGVVFRIDRLDGDICVAFPNKACPPVWALPQ